MSERLIIRLVAALFVALVVIMLWGMCNGLRAGVIDITKVPLLHERGSVNDTIYWRGDTLFLTNVRWIACADSSVAMIDSIQGSGTTVSIIDDTLFLNAGENDTATVMWFNGTDAGIMYQPADSLYFTIDGGSTWDAFCPISEVGSGGWVWDDADLWAWLDSSVIKTEIAGWALTADADSFYVDSTKLDDTFLKSSALAGSETDPTLTDDGAVTIGDGVQTSAVITFDTDVDDATFSWVDLDDRFEFNKGVYSSAYYRTAGYIYTGTFIRDYGGGYLRIAADVADSDAVTWGSMTAQGYALLTEVNDSMGPYFDSAEVVDTVEKMIKDGPEIYNKIDTTLAKIPTATLADSTNGGAIRAETAKAVVINAIDSTHIINNGVSYEDLATDIIDSTHIMANGIGYGDIHANSVTSGHIIDNSLIADDIAANAIEASEIKDQEVKAAEVDSTGELFRMECLRVIDSVRIANSLTVEDTIWCNFIKSDSADVMEYGDVSAVPLIINATSIYYDVADDSLNIDPTKLRGEIRIPPAYSAYDDYVLKLDWSNDSLYYAVDATGAGGLTYWAESDDNDTSVFAATGGNVVCAINDRLSLKGNDITWVGNLEVLTNITVGGTVDGKDVSTLTDIGQTIGLSEMDANSVDSTKIVDDGVGNEDLHADCVTGAELVDDAVNSEHYTDGSIDTVHINDTEFWEYVQDHAGGMFSGNTENEITVTYNEDGTVDFDVDDEFLFNDGDTAASGTYDFGGATSFELPNGANPTTAVEGEIAWDSDDKGLEIFDDSSRVISSYEDIDALIFAPDQVNDEIPIFHVDGDKYPGGIKIVNVQITIPSDGAYTMTFEEWAGDPPANQNTIEAVTTGSGDSYMEVVGSNIDDSDLDVGDYIFLDIPSDDIDWVHVKVIFWIKDFD